MEPKRAAFSSAPKSAPNSFQNAHDFNIENQYNVGGNLTHIVQNTGQGLFDALNPLPDASHTRNRRTSPPDSQCLPGTRTDLIERIASCIDGSVSSAILNAEKCHIMWLYGYVGCGKSAIAQTVAERYAQRGRLAASFFFFRRAGDRSRSTRLAATIAAQLAAAIPSTAPKIAEALRTQPGLLHPTTSLSAQFQHLIFKPIKVATKWSRMSLDILRGPYLIVLDGLDECEDSGDIAHLVDDALQFFKDNPRVPLRLFITSRVEEHLRTRLTTSQVHLLNLVDETSDEDIELAMRAAFARAAKHDRAVQAYGHWPNDDQVAKLVKCAGRSFIFMSTLVKFILEPSNDGLIPKTRLPLALELNPGLDGLYAHTLSRSQHLPHFLDIIRTIALLQAPISIVELANLLSIQRFEVIQVLVNLHAIFQVPGDDITPITMCHSSLADYLTTESRSLSFYAVPAHETRIACSCMNIVATADSKAPAFEYATEHWKIHWIRMSGVSRRQSQTPFMPLEKVFPSDAIYLVAATLILVDPDSISFCWSIEGRNVLRHPDSTPSLQETYEVGITGKQVSRTTNSTRQKECEV